MGYSDGPRIDVAVNLLDAEPHRFVRPRLAPHCVAIACTLVVLQAGCSDDGRLAVYPVKGKVTVAGEVPEGALIVLHPVQGGKFKDIRPSAKVTRDGSFRLTTYEADDGAPAGEYAATIQWNKLIKRGSDYVAGPNVIPKAYEGPQTSPWKFTVAAATNELVPLDIKR